MSGEDIKQFNRSIETYVAPPKGIIDARVSAVVWARGSVAILDKGNGAEDTSPRRQRYGSLVYPGQRQQGNPLLLQPLMQLFHPGL
ncbi:hypothetical protein SAMN04488540_11652 [Ferrimonas sediminum]|uniref:Uncharacterized protein n=1 Tax=Ferrimonas sediminum TaxID=718193 RepID=A0A1G8Y1A1_9GAMM|nr:hypothetical protein SAMN04488540_11652 [Ferrimonas sediminum]